MVAADRIEKLIAPSVEAMGYDLIRVRLAGTARPVLQIMAERPDGTMNVDDCAAISRAVSAILDVEDPIAGEYELEVSSPGIDRPLVRLKDFERYCGFVAKIEAQEPLTSANGQKRFRGQITSVDGTLVHVDCDGGSVAIEYDNIASAKLVLTDELVEASLRSQ
jgi:ribosome maturation factor RimP